MFILDKASEKNGRIQHFRGFHPLRMYVHENISVAISTIKSKSHTFGAQLVRINSTNLNRKPKLSEP
jgi:hypothetical protein